ncbi:J domain-containing protein [Ancylobacter sp.]|uniref:J domain-containing protein n=1 Tax=Ancylobacter sp. TaxID=1872567 RepID=UPI003D0A6FE8
MAEHDALDAALALFKDPVSARRMPHIALPQGTAMVLAVAVGDEAALAAAERRSGIGRDTLRQAAGFFVEQAMLFHDADSYRVLGTRRSATHEELRHNMALLMRWLHPDLQSLRSGPLDREVFTARVSRAWEDLKTDERRSAYEVRHPQPPQASPARGAPGPMARQSRPGGASFATSPARTSTVPRGAAKGSAGKGNPGRSPPASGAGKPAAMAGAAKLRFNSGAAARRRPLALRVSKIEGASFWVRLWGFIWRRR